MTHVYVNVPCKICICSMRNVKINIPYIMNIYEHIAWIFVNYNESLPKFVFAILWGMLGAPKNRVFSRALDFGGSIKKFASLLPSRSTNIAIAGTSTLLMEEIFAPFEMESIPSGWWFQPI